MSSKKSAVIALILGCMLVSGLHQNAQAGPFDRIVDRFSEARNPDQEILDPEKAFVLDVDVISHDRIKAHWLIAEGYYLYRDKFRFAIQSPGTVINNVKTGHGKYKDDPDFGRVEVVYHEAQAEIMISRTEDGDDEVSLLVGYQGCKEDVVCYPPVTKTVSLNIPAGIGMPAGRSGIQEVRVVQSAQDTITRKLGEQGIMINILFFLGFGLLLSFTPCVFPMVPILSGIIVGQGREITTRRAFILSAVYVLSMAVTYSLLGVIAGLFNINLQATFQNPVLITAFSLVFIILALAMFGFFEIRIPAALQNRLEKVSHKQQKGTLRGCAVMGTLSAIIVGPCVAPPLAGALLYISQTGDAVLGGLALLALGIGMGIPLLVIGTSAGHLLPRAGAWMKTIQYIFGVILLGVAIWFLERILPGPVTLFLWSLLLVVTSIYIGALEDADGHWQKLWKGMGLVMLTYGLAAVIGVALGGSSILNPLQKISFGSQDESGHLEFTRIKTVTDLDEQITLANSQGKKVMLDFYADWCITCKEMETRTFSKSSVQDSLHDFILLQADVTRYDDEDKQLLDRFGLYGPPAILFFDTGGNEQNDFRLVGFVSEADFILHIDLFRQL